MEIKNYLHLQDLWDVVKNGDELMQGNVKVEKGASTSAKLIEFLEPKVWLKKNYDAMLIISNTLTTFVILHSKKCMTKRYVGCTCTNTCLELKT